EIMAWCEAQRPVVYYCLGLGPNSRLVGMIQDALATARGRRCLTGAPSAREFKDLEYQTRQSWSRSRRVVGKAEVMAGGDNPRFIVTNLPREGFRGEDRERFAAARLYEELYCARGDLENQLKQQVLDLQADRMSTHYLASNQLRLGEPRRARGHPSRISSSNRSAQNSTSQNSITLKSSADAATP